MVFNIIGRPPRSAGDFAGKTAKLTQGSANSAHPGSGWKKAGIKRGRSCLRRATGLVKD
jgi:hypothetical protein